MKKSTTLKHYTYVTCLIILYFFHHKGITQTRCSLGDPVFVENFGSGTDRLGPSLNQDPNTNVHPNFRPADLYNYVGGTGNVGQGDYGIMKNPKDATPSGAPWNDSFTDHTGNENGYLYYCDAIEALNVFYAQKINGLCNDIEYELSAWFAKTNPPNSTVNPNIKMIIGFTDINDQNIGNIIEVDSGPIDVIGDQRWNRRNLVFTVPDRTENIYFMLRNNLSGRVENDLAIDDIEVRPCGPELMITDLQSNSVIEPNESLCFNEMSSKIISLSANTPVSFIQQWQESFGNGIWKDIAGETSNILNHTLSLGINPAYSIRLKFANNSSNFNNKSCYFLSQEVGTDLVTSFKPNDINLCDNQIDNNGLNGIVQNFNLESQTPTILNGQSPMNYTVSYYLSRPDAETGINALISPHENSLSPFSQTIYAKVISLRSGCSSPIISFDLTVNPLPDFTVETPQSICALSQPITLSPIITNISDTFTYEWMFEDGTILSNESTLKDVVIPGIYSITLTKTDNSGCFSTKKITVKASGLSTITIDDIVINDISNSNTITINTNNLEQGDFEFALDNEFSSYQDEPLFSNVSAGIHTLYIKDKKGCGIRSFDISVIGFPKHFTPNGDNINDYWQIDGFNDQFQANGVIFIFNRYGKLLKQLDANSKGWDGRFNNAMLPTDEYWFKAILSDGRTFVNHFTLKR